MFLVKKKFLAEFLRRKKKSSSLNVSVKSKLQHAPPGQPPGHFENYCSNSPLPGPKCRSNAPHWGPFRWSNAPTPGTFHRHKNDRRTEETPSIVEQNLYKYNKNWETLLAYLLRTKVSCKAAEIAATTSLNAQLFFVMQQTKRSIKEIPPIEITTSWPFHWHASSLTLLINILAVGQTSSPELFILFYVDVLNRRYRYCISLSTQQ